LKSNTKMSNVSHCKISLLLISITYNANGMIKDQNDIML